MKTYEVTLMRNVPQTATVRVEADDACDATSKAIDTGDEAQWKSGPGGEVFYRECTEVTVEEKTVTKELYGYTIELELFEEDGDQRSDCSVVRTVRGIEYGGSLGMLIGFGTLENYRTGDEYDVPERHQKAIIKWAEDNGY